MTTLVRRIPTLMLLALAMAGGCRNATAPADTAAAAADVPAAAATAATTADASRSSSVAQKPAPAGPAVAKQAGPVPAQAPQAGMGADLAWLGGTMHAASEMCGEDAAGLETRKQAQKREYQRRGGDAEAFERAYLASYARAREEIDKASQAQREESCRNLDQLARAASAR